MSANQEPVFRTAANENPDWEHLASGQLSQCKAQPALKCIDRSSLAPAPLRRRPPALCKVASCSLQTPTPCAGSADPTPPADREA